MMTPPRYEARMLSVPLLRLDQEIQLYWLFMLLLLLQPLHPPSII